MVLDKMNCDKAKLEKDILANAHNQNSACYYLQKKKNSKYFMVKNHKKY